MSPRRGGLDTLVAQFVRGVLIGFVATLFATFWRAFWKGWERERARRNDRRPLRQEREGHSGQLGRGPRGAGKRISS